MLMGRDRRELIETTPALVDADMLKALRRAVPQVHVSEALVAYVQRLLAATPCTRKSRPACLRAQAWHCCAPVAHWHCCVAARTRCLKMCKPFSSKSPRIASRPGKAMVIA